MLHALPIIGRLFGSGFQGRPDPGVALAVIGDVHGYLDHYRDLVAEIEKWFGQTAADRRIIVQVGDMIDRGPDSLGCIDYSMELSARREFEFRGLLGNHEIMMRHCLASDEACGEHAVDWLLYGGRETVESLFGMEQAPGLAEVSADPATFRTQLLARLGASRIAYIEGLETHFRCGNIVAVHAGLPANVDGGAVMSFPWQARSADHWAWNCAPGERGIRMGRSQVYPVHGHNIHGQPGPVGQRFAVDTGVYRSGCLSAGLFCENGYETRSVRLSENTGQG